jgi:hypothetical protein
MAKNKNPQPAPETTRLTAYQVREFEQNGETKSDWTRIGVAFPHEDGKGFNVLLHALPVDGKIVMRVFEPKPDDNAPSA